jgi:hypothetical protein
MKNMARIVKPDSVEWGNCNIWGEITKYFWLIHFYYNIINYG